LNAEASTFALEASRDRYFSPENYRSLVDANMRWSVDEAIRAARGLSEFAVYWLEEPTIPDGERGFAGRPECTLPETEPG
jgi:L-alanine-DL-glutamate epimerase-like enolase superfamily enzyme